MPQQPEQEQSKERTINLAEVRHQIIAALESGEITKKDVYDFTKLLDNQANGRGFLPAAAIRAGRLAEGAYVTNSQGLLITPGDEAHRQTEEPEAPPLSAAGRLSD